MPSFRERLRPPYSLYLALVLLIPAMLVIFLPIDPRIGYGVAPVVFVAAVITVTFIAPTVEVVAGELAAGGARLPLDFVGELTVLRGGEAALERGQRLDARAWLVIRGGIDAVVKVEVTDDRDPAPYWLVSSRRPEELVAAISAARGARLQGT